MTESDQEREDEVLRRMLKTPPTPHKPQSDEAKTEKQKRAKAQFP